MYILHAACPRLILQELRKFAEKRKAHQRKLTPGGLEQSTLLGIVRVGRVSLGPASLVVEEVGHVESQAPIFGVDQKEACPKNAWRFHPDFTDER